VIVEPVPTTMPVPTIKIMAKITLVINNLNGNIY